MTRDWRRRKYVGAIIVTGDGIVAGAIVIGDGVIAGTAAIGNDESSAINSEQARMAGLFSIHAADIRC